MQPGALPPGAVFAGHRIIRLLGRGGMGAVYEAEDAAGRVVALKLVLGNAAADDELRRRFEREARAAATVVHENVARCFGSGAEGAVPFIAFELLTGGTLKDVIKKRGRLPPREAAAIGAAVARGLAAIHAAGLVHRDLKPENVLLDGEGRPKVSDLGLVGRTGAARDAQSIALTKTGEVLGTIAYMAPEQIDRAKSADARADLYALGCVLYALLTTRPPFEGQPYELMTSHLMERPRPPSALGPAVPPRLEALVLRLLEKDPAARPQSASEVAHELEAIAAEAGAARRPAAWLVAIGAVAVLALGAGAFALRPRPPRTAEVVTPRPGDPRPKERPEPAKPPAPAPSAFPELCRGFEKTKLASLARVLGEHRGASALVAREHLWKHERGVYAVAWSPDGKTALSGSEDHTVKLWSAETGGALRSFPEDAHVFDAAFFPDGKRVVVVDTRGFVRVFGIDGKPVASFAHGGSAFAVAVSPDGQLVASGGSDRTVKLWSLASDAPVASFPTTGGKEVSSIAFTPDGKSLLAAAQGPIEVFDVATGAPRTIGPKDAGAFRVAFASGARAFAATEGGTVIRFWDMQSGAEAYPPIRGTASSAFSLSPDGARAAWSDETVKLHVSDVASGREVVAFPAHNDRITRTAFSPDGRRLLSACWDGTLRLWEIEGQGQVVASLAVAGDRLLSAAYEGKLVRWEAQRGDWRNATRSEVGDFPATRGFRQSIAFADDHTAIVGCGGTEPIRLDVKSGQRTEFGGSPERRTILSLAASPRLVLCGCDDGQVRIWDRDQMLYSDFFIVEPNRWVNAVAFSPDGESMLAGAAQRLAFRGLTGVPKHVTVHAGVTAIAFASKGFAFVGMEDGTIERFPDSGDRIRAHDGRVEALAVAPRRGLLLSSGGDGKIKLWDENAKAAIPRDTIDLASSADVARSLAFASDDGTAFFAGTARGVVLRFELKR